MLERNALNCFVVPLQVIYGDTDSIMIHTNSNDYEQAEQLGARIKTAVNRWGAAQACRGGQGGHNT